MTDNIKPAVQEKSAWAKVPQEFNDWWNGDYSDDSNPFRFNSAAYWAWAGWSEAVRLNAQAVPDTREMFNAGWSAAARFCDREDVVYDGLVGPGGCPAFEEAYRAAFTALSAAPAAPAAPQPLTDEQIYGLYRRAGLEAYHLRDVLVQRTYDKCINDFARAIEQAHGIGVKP